MKRTIMLISSLILITTLTSAQFTLTIEITGLRNNTGKIMLQLFDEYEKVIMQEMAEITNKTSSMSIKNLKPGKYAVRYFHDENLNGKMETNMFGKPTEGYGFSNNVIGTLGPPPFEKWLFEISENKKITLKPTY